MVVGASRRARRAVSRRSGEGIVYSAIDVKKWAEEIPSVEAARPGRCSCCGAPSRPAGARLVVRGHGLRERQVRGPATARGIPEIRTIRVRRYQCQLCSGLTTVLPRGLTARRHYSASAIGLALCLHGMRGLSLAETRSRVCAWRCGFDMERWTTLPKWLAAIAEGQLFGCVRPCPASFTVRERAERAAATLCSLALHGGSLDEQAFEGAALAA